MKKLPPTLALAALLTVPTGPSQAAPGLIGDSVTVAYDGAGFASTSFVVTNASPDGNLFGNQFFDLGTTIFAVSSIGDFCGIWDCGAAPVSLVLTSLDLGAPITGLSFSSLLAGVTYSFTATSVTFTWTEQNIPTGEYLTATFLTGTAVPEPASLALLGAGLLGLGVLRRRRAAA